MGSQARMAEESNDVTRHGVHAGLMGLVVEFQERLFPGTVALGQQGMRRRGIFAVENSNRVEKMDGLDKGPALRENTALVLEHNGMDSVILGQGAFPLLNRVGMGETRLLSISYVFGEKERLETGMIPLEMPNCRKCVPVLVRHRTLDTNPF